MDQPFTEEQKQYLQGFMAGAVQSGALPFVGRTVDGRITGDPAMAESDLAQPDRLTVHGTPVDDLSAPERAKLEKDPLRMWDEVEANAAAGRFPKGDDVFRYKALGLFYVAPAQDAFMLRCRIPGGVLTTHQVRGLAGIARSYGGGYVDLTTRGNVQIREISATDAVHVLLALRDLGLTSLGAGADNVRNVTATPTAGFDPAELYDVRPLARAMHYYILHSPDLYDLPRKFNIAFDGGGSVSVAANTNDIAFSAVRDGYGGVLFSLALGGITGHEAFARETGLAVRAADTVAVAAAVIRVYLEHGDRTNRKRARLKYLLDAWRMDRFIEAVRDRLAVPLLVKPTESGATPAPVRHRHIGLHPQKQEGWLYAGVVVPQGRLKADQLCHLADLSERLGSSDLRLTVFQNVLIPGIAEPDAEAAVREIRAAGLDVAASAVRAGMVACTGSAGCQYANADTKADARRLADYLDEFVALDQPINIHLTGCPHSCAQHYCGDVGLLGTRVKTADGSVDGYHVHLGGGMDAEHGVGRRIASSVPATGAPRLIRGILERYLAARRAGESFIEFTRRHGDEELRDVLKISN